MACVRGGLGELEARLRGAQAAVRRGGDYERWDLETRVGALGAARLRLGIEEHDAGRQMTRWRMWPNPSTPATIAAALLAALASVRRSIMPARGVAAWAASGLLAWRVAADCGRALAAIEPARGARERA